MEGVMETIHVFFQAAAMRELLYANASYYHATS